METGRFRRPCESFLINTCNALGDSRCSIKSYAIIVWKESLSFRAYKCMTLELMRPFITTQWYRQDHGGRPDKQAKGGEHGFHFVWEVSWSCSSSYFSSEYEQERFLSESIHSLRQGQARSSNGLCRVYRISGFLGQKLLELTEEQATNFRMIFDRPERSERVVLLSTNSSPEVLKRICRQGSDKAGTVVNRFQQKTKHSQRVYYHVSPLSGTSTPGECRVCRSRAHLHGSLSHARGVKELKDQSARVVGSEIKIPITISYGRTSRIFPEMSFRTRYGHYDFWLCLLVHNMLQRNMGPSSHCIKESYDKRKLDGQVSSANVMVWLRMCIDCGVLCGHIVSSRRDYWMAKMGFSTLALPLTKLCERVRSLFWMTSEREKSFEVLKQIFRKQTEFQVDCDAFLAGHKFMCTKDPALREVLMKAISFPIVRMFPEVDWQRFSREGNRLDSGTPSAIVSIEIQFLGLVSGNGLQNVGERLKSVVFTAFHPEPDGQNCVLLSVGSTDEEDEDEVMTTKDDDLLFYQDTFPVDKFVPFGKAMGSKRIEKSPTIPVAVLGLCNTLTWVEIEKKLRKKPPMKH
ncbi:hypothetical protein Tco_1411209 [Tanacetum coccineum]